MNWRRRVNGRFLTNQSGISLLEVLVAIGILALIGTAVIGGLDTNYRGNQTLDEKVIGVNLTTAYIEAIRNLPYAASYPTAGDDIVKPAQYTVLVETDCSSDAVTYIPCTGEETETFQRITVTVSHADKQVFSACAYRSK